jgi:FtsP/CotA-like multicopper oxidase with cupredoxin domain
MDGVTGIGRGNIEVGETFTYEFDALPFGCHLYHCHAIPLKRHIHKGLYGAFIIDPDPEKHGEKARSRHPDYEESQEWQEFVMIMNAFDTTFDGENEVYAINSVAFHYMKHPIRVERDRPVRVYLINITEFDPINSFHLHGNFFNYYDHGTTLEPTLRTVDTIMQCQAQRGILEISFAGFEPGLYMFHAHQSEFPELGWMSAFDVVE